MTGRTILHVDMNAFFASVEQQSDPSLRGKPIAVIGSAARTVITTASYEARAFGVRTGMNVPEAKRACRDLILVVGNNRKYTYTSTQIMGLLREFTPLIEVFSIDEAFLDLTGSITLFRSPHRPPHQGANPRRLRTYLLRRHRSQQAPRQACLGDEETGRADGD